MNSKSRQLPVFEIMGNEFLVDVEKERFIEKANPGNTISFHWLQYKGTHYDLEYNLLTKNAFGEDKMNIIIKVPQLVELDPEGMSTKYKIGMSKMEGKSDFDLRVDPQRYHARVNQGQLPIVTIHEDKFFVDLRLHELRLTTDPFKKIALPENFIANKGSYEFYYSLRTQEAVEINPNMTKLPGKVFKVTVPPARKLDPVAVARIERKEIKDYLMKCPFEKEVTAKVIPLSETELKQRAKLNKEASKKKEEDSLLKKNRGNNHRGKHL